MTNMAKILIIDDDRDILRMMEFALERAGHQPEITTNANNALTQIKENPPDLIIVDIMMPEMTGYAFTKAVRTQLRLTELPILIYSARAQSVDRQAALDAGATDYMPKTIPPPEMVQKINTALGDKEGQKPGTGSSIIACYSLRGGVGVTSIAVNIAAILAMSQKTPACLLDFNQLAGHAALMLGLRPQTHLYHVLTNAQELTVDLLKDNLTDHKSGVRLLASPLSPDGNPLVHSPYDLVQIAQTAFQFTIIDLPHQLNEAHQALLQEVDKLLLVLSPDVPSLQSTVAARKYLTQLGLDRAKINPILNQTRPKAGLSLDAMQKTIRQPMLATIPYEENMSAAITAGQPLVIFNAKSPTTAELARLTLNLIK